MPSLHPTGKRRWVIRWREDGKQRASERYTTRGDGEAALLALKDRLAAKRPVAGRLVISLREIVNRWGDRLDERRSKRYATESRKRLLAIVKDKKWKRAEQVDADTLSVGDFRLMRSCLGFARDRLKQAVPELVAPERRSRPPRRPDLLTAERVAALVAEARAWSPGAGAIAHMVATYGHRPQSLVGLTVDAFDAKAATLTLGVKSGDEVRHPLLPATSSILAALAGERDPSDHLFLDHNNEPWPSGHVFSTWFHHRVGGYKIGIYQLKRFAISNMLAKGLDLATIASLTGHRTLNTLLVYARTNETRQRAALEALSK